jgi:hypothetical protein
MASETHFMNATRGFSRDPSDSAYKPWMRRGGDGMANDRQEHHLTDAFTLINGVQRAIGEQKLVPQIIQMNVGRPQADAFRTVWSPRLERWDVRLQAAVDRLLAAVPEADLDAVIADAADAARDISHVMADLEVARLTYPRELARLEPWLIELNRASEMLEPARLRDALPR